MSLKIVSLEIIDPQSGNNKKYNFDSEVSVSNLDAPVVLQDLLNLVSNSVKNTSQSILEMQLEKVVMRIQKNHLDGSVKYFLNEEEKNIDIYEWLSENLKLQITPQIWESRLVDFKSLEININEDLQNIIKSRDSLLLVRPDLSEELSSLKAQFEKSKSESLKGLTPEQIQKIERLADIRSKIAKIQKEVDSYQSLKDRKEELNKGLKDKEIEVNILKDKLESVESLIVSKEKITKELQSFNNPTQANLEDLKQKKNLKTHEFLQTAYTKPIHMINDLEGDDSGSKLSFRKILLIVQIPLTLLLVILGYLIIKEELLLFVGFIVIALEFIFILFEVFKKPTENLNLLEAEAPQVSSVNLPLEPGNDRLFVNEAWRKAYEQELSKIDQLITSNLNERLYEDVEKEKLLKSNELTGLQKQVADMEANALDSESYYKKRRELDILKIEKENIEFGAGQIQVDPKLDEMSSKINDIEGSLNSIDNLRSQIPLIVINVKETIKGMLNEISDGRQIILINNSKL